MLLDKNFVRNLNPSIAGRLRHGDLLKIAKKTGITPLSVRNAVNGATNNGTAVKEAIRLIIEDSKLTVDFIDQIPGEVIAEIMQPSS